MLGSWDDRKRKWKLLTVSGEVFGLGNRSGIIKDYMHYGNYWGIWFPKIWGCLVGFSMLVEGFSRKNLRRYSSFRLSTVFDT